MYEELTDFCGRDQIMQTPVRNLDFIVCAESSPWNIIREKECERIYIKKKKKSILLHSREPVWEEKTSQETIWKDKT